MTGRRVAVIPYFGDPWDAPMLDLLDGDDEDTAVVRVPTPTHLRCSDCGEPIVEGDQGVMRPVLDCDDAGKPIAREGAMHAECELSAVAGHIFGACSCTMPDASRRERAFAAVAALDERRAAEGRGPWRER